MGRLSCHVRRIRVGFALVLLASTLAAPIAVFADSQDDDERKPNLNCPGRETLVRVDEAFCPATPHRPFIVRKRACCQNPRGTVHCDHFEHCPSQSPS